MDSNYSCEVLLPLMQCFVNWNNLCASVNNLSVFVIDKSGHSDPTKLKETAQDVQRFSPNELKKRQMEIKVKIIYDLWLRDWNK